MSVMAIALYGNVPDSGSPAVAVDGDWGAQSGPRDLPVARRLRSCGWRPLEDLGRLVDLVGVVGGADAGGGHARGVGQVDELVGPRWVKQRPY